ncbi:MAG: polysaccharide pyruvyl transferase family protein [Armatimonadota bacterium]
METECKQQNISEIEFIRSEPDYSNIRFLILASDGNIGDYAMLSCVIKRLRFHYPKCQISILANSLSDYIDLPDISIFTYGNNYFSLTNRFFDSIHHQFSNKNRLSMLFRYFNIRYAAKIHKKWYYRKLWGADCRSLIDLLGSFSCIIASGGGYLNSIWWAEELWRKCIYMSAGIVMGIPVILSGQGIGPITTRLDKYILKAGIKQANWISLRGKGESEDNLLQLGIPANKFDVVGDDAVDLSICSDSRLKEIMAIEGICLDHSTIVVNARLTRYSCEGNLKEKQVFAAFLDQIIEKYHYHIVFVPLSYDDVGGTDDRASALEIIKFMQHHDATYRVMGRYRPDEIKAIVGVGDMAFGMSYHFAVFALTQGIPCFSFYCNEYYRLKYCGLYTQFGNNNWYHQLNEDGIKICLTQIDSITPRLSDIPQELTNYTAKMNKRVDEIYSQISSMISTGCS